jgi:Sap, sulfolipid-1-addressing protein
MGDAIGQSLPLAVGVALSPIPIIAVVLMLTTPRARTNGPSFVIGWLVGLSLVGGLVLALAGPADAGESGRPATWVGWLEIVLGVLLLVVALRQFRGRPHEGEEAPLPKWMGALDNFKPAASLGAGVVLAGANPKNLLLVVGGAAAIAKTGIPGTEQAISFGLFALIGTIGVGAPVVIFFALGARAAETLGRLKDWMGHNNAVIMAVLCLVIGIKLIGDGLSGLTS